MKRAIVLSGGGSKGAYQIGAWRALRKLHIKYDIVTGTSVGSLNGALMTQKTYFRGIWFWYNINFKRIFKENIDSNYQTKEGKKSIFRHYVRAIFVNNGLDVSNLEKNVDRVLNERKVRKSKIDFGFITFNLSNLKPVVLTKDKIPNGKLKDYLMASATCFPAFKKKNIDDVSYIDGGYYDNLPVNLAIEMGADEIIAVDLRAIGMRRRIKKKDVKITYISPRNNLGSFLIFHRDLARRGIRLGYNDTMKTYGKLDGNRFTFKHGDLKNNYEIYNAFYNKTMSEIFGKRSNNAAVQLLKLTTYKSSIMEDDFNKIIEFLGKTFKIDDSYIYDIEYFNKLLIRRLEALSSTNKNIVEQKLKSSDIRNLANSQYIIKYLYDMITDDQNIKLKKQLSSMALLLSHEFLGALYLYVMKHA